MDPRLILRQVGGSGNTLAELSLPAGEYSSVASMPSRLLFFPTSLTLNQ